MMGSNQKPKRRYSRLNAWESVTTVSSASYSGGERIKLGNEFSNGARYLWKNETLPMALCVYTNEKRIRIRQIEQFRALSFSWERCMTSKKRLRGRLQLDTICWK